MNSLSGQTTFPENPDKKISVILLGAGYPYQGGVPSSLQEAPDRRHILDWIMDAFSGFTPQWHFVGGFQIDHVVNKYPELNYSFNANWQTTSVVESLFSAPLLEDADHFISYTDIIYSKEIVRLLDQSDGDIVIAADSAWRDRYDGRSRKDMEAAEKLILSGKRVVSMGKDADLESANAEFAGLIKVSPRAIKAIMELRSTTRSALSDSGLLELLELLGRQGLAIQAVDIKGKWAELNAPQDLARYVLGTKSDTLERLKPMVRHSSIGEQVSFQVSEWEENPTTICQKIRNLFDDELIVVRSSSRDEDSWNSANAGKFLSLTNISATEEAVLVEAVDRVIESYNSAAPENQVLVQQMVLSPALSGVIFTKTLRTGAPYYVINYDDRTGRTDTVTSGLGEDLKALVIHRSAKHLTRHHGLRFQKLLEAVWELETLIGHDSLDIEFAITPDGVVHILQIRPIVINHVDLRVSDIQLENMLADAERRFTERQSPSPQVAGQKTAFGIMPDWNPAEMIGTSPRLLALSLYRHLITDEIWAKQRAEYGYRDVRPQNLMTTFMGHPYIDIRTCFNSFIPEGLDPEFTESLADYYINELTAKPHLHDKVEFEILFTSMDFCTDDRLNKLQETGFSQKNVQQLRDQLIKITEKAFAQHEKDFDALKTLQERYEVTMSSSLSTLDKAFTLLEDCRRWGTLPFAHLARSAFVATSFLKSAVTKGLLSDTYLQDYMRSISTIAHQLTEDTRALADGSLSKDAFLSTYGHLRPGTYEITSPRYIDAPDQFLGNLSSAQGREDKNDTPFSWQTETAQNLMSEMRRIGLPDDMDTFDTFLRKTIEGREYGKFIFSRNLSAALDMIAAYGEELGINREDLSHIPITDFMAVKAGSYLGTPAEWLKERATEGRKANNISQMAELPPLVFETMDFRAFHYPENHPNFVSLSIITAPVEDLTDTLSEPHNLEGKLVLIPHADPGFDWIFSHRIAGLMTKYGGANSHMAIRAAEFGLAAAIGLGELEYNKLRQATKLELDCASRRIRIVQ